MNMAFNEYAHENTKKQRKGDCLSLPVEPQETQSYVQIRRARHLYSYRVEADAEEQSPKQHLSQVQRVIGIGAAGGGQPSRGCGGCQGCSQSCDLPEVAVA